MSLFDTDIVERDYLVKDFYELHVVNLGMMGSCEQEARVLFKGFTLGEVYDGMKNTPLDKFESLFEGDTYVQRGVFRFITRKGRKLRKYLGQWVKKEFIRDCEDLYRESHGDRRILYVSNKSKVIEWATTAKIMFVFIKK